MQHGVSPELSGKFEGDIELSNVQMRQMFAKNGMINTNYKWPERTIPYQVSNNHGKFLKYSNNVEFKKKVF